MNGIEMIAYTIAGIALIASCATYIFASKITRLCRRALLARLATWMAAGALLALLTGLAIRGITAHRWPIGTPFEFTLAFAASILMLYIALRNIVSIPLPGAIATLLASLLMLYAFFFQPETVRTIQPLPPVMRGLWFYLHTVLTALAYGALGIAGSIALPVLSAQSQGNQDEGSDTLGPQAKTLVDRAMAIAYVMLSLGIISGAIWAELAWGEYWTWSIKENLTLMTWLLCTLYYHVRYRHSWRNKWAMWVPILALATVLLNLFFTPTLLNWTRLQPLHIY